MGTPEVEPVVEVIGYLIALALSIGAVSVVLAIGMLIGEARR